MKIVPFVGYDPDTGRIIQIGVCPAGDLEMQAIGMSVLQGTADLELDYVVNGEVVRRPDLPGFDKLTIQADDTDAAVLDLGEPFVATIDGTDYEVVDGCLEITSPMPAIYEVEINHFPYLPYKAKVVAS